MTRPRPMRTSLRMVSALALALAFAGCGGRTGLFGANVTPDPEPGCGNGVLEPDLGEQCDGENLGGFTCLALGFPGGTLRCSGTCGFATGGCEGEGGCGDGRCDPGEGETCATCPPDCCPTCGNGSRDGAEQCDGADLGGETCASLCFAGGTLACGPGCRFDEGGCYGGPVCGDGVIGCGEGCDGLDLGGQSCESLGYQGGTLACRADCTLDEGGCTGRLYYLWEDFEDPGHAALWGLAGDWEWGAPNGGVGEPAAAFAGTQCLGTAMHRQYGHDRQFLTNLAVTPSIDLRSASAPVLSFVLWVRTESCCDGGRLFVRPAGSGTWMPLDGPSLPYNGTVGGQQVWRGLTLDAWREVTVDLSAFVGQEIELGFSLYSDASVAEAGVYVDDVLVSEAGGSAVLITTPFGLGQALVASPFTRQLQATGGSGAYVWSMRSGGANDQWLTVDPGSGLLSGTPADSALGPVQVVIRAEDAGDPASYDERVFFFEVVAGAWLESFDAGPGGWTLTGDWQWGTAAGGGCRSGACLATVLDGQYRNNQTFTGCTATSPPIDLTGLASPRLRFWGWLQSENDFDGGNVKISAGGGPFTVLDGFSPPYGDTLEGQPVWTNSQAYAHWQPFEASLLPYAGQVIQLQLSFRSDGSVTFAGWYVDDVEIHDAGP